jgi:hypothetical protein
MLWAKYSFISIARPLVEFRTRCHIASAGDRGTQDKYTLVSVCKCSFPQQLLSLSLPLPALVGFIVASASLGSIPLKASPVLSRRARSAPARPSPARPHITRVSFQVTSCLPVKGLHQSDKGVSWRFGPARTRHGRQARGSVQLAGLVRAGYTIRGAIIS